MEPLRLSKLMASRGLCSRREADEYIRLGMVWVDGKRITELGTKVLPNAEVVLDPRARAQQEKLVTFLLNKPIGYVSSQPEKGYPPAVKLLTPENRFGEDRRPAEFHPRQLTGLAPAGRLDIDSTGLLVLTQDGRLARRLIGEDAEPIEKEYLVRVSGQVAPATLRGLRGGLVLDGRPLKEAKVMPLQPGVLQFILTEGRKRQIRRMCELVGLKVTGLKRVRIGKVVLGKLPVGKWRYLAPGEDF